MVALSSPLKGETFKKAGAYFEPLKVSAQDAPNLTVKVGAGGFWVDQVTYVEFSGGNSPLVTPPGSLAKWVFVTLKVDGTIELLNGVPGTSPMQPVVPADDRLPLAALFVNAGTTAITNGMISDLRPLFNIGTVAISHVDIINRNHPDAHNIASITALQTELNNRALTANVNNSLALKADVDGTPDLIFILNKDEVGVPTNNVSLRVERGTNADVEIRWNEGLDIWEFTEDGSIYKPLNVMLGSFYTKVELDGGQLDNRYFTEVELNGGQLDSRYFTETEVNTFLALKADKVVAAVNQNFASLNPLGNLLDSGFSALSFALANHNHDTRYYQKIESDGVPGGPGAKINKVVGTTVGHIAIFAAGGELSSSGVPVAGFALAANHYLKTENDGVAGVAGAKIDKVTAATAGAVPTLTAAGQLANSAVLLASVALTASHYTKAESDGLAGSAGAKTDKVAAAVAGRFAGLTALGNLTDSGFSSASFSLAGHTHTASQITDFNAAWTARHNLAVIDELADVVIAGPVIGHFLRWNGVAWVNVAIVKADVSNFVEGSYIHTTGVEAKSGDMTFNDSVTVGGNLTVQGTTTTVNSNTVNIGDNILRLNVDVVGPPTENAGLEIERGTLTDASIIWNETIDAWQAGLTGSEVTLSLVGHTHVSGDVTDFVEAAQDAAGAAMAAGVNAGITATYVDVSNRVDLAVQRTFTHPDYALFVGTGAAAYVLGFVATAPVAGRASLIVFVNGVKQVEGGLKAYTVNYGTSTVTFNAPFPLVADDVEMYGYG